MAVKIMPRDTKKILIIIATHGDEKIGVEVVERLTKQGLAKYFDYLVANPRALAKDQEFIDANLNRLYPGKKNSSLYEEQRAYENIQIAKKYKYIIDIHEASQSEDDFIIVPRKKLSDQFPCSLIDLKKLLLWPPSISKSSSKGPLTQFFENGIELEFGMKGRNREKVISKATDIVKIFIKNVNENADIPLFPKKEIYYVFEKLMEGDGVNREKLRNFKKTMLGGEKFYPLLVGQYLKRGIVCYKMRRIK